MKIIFLLYTLTLCQSLSVHRQKYNMSTSTFDNNQNSKNNTQITDNLKTSNLPGDKTGFTKQQTANILLVLLKLGVEPTFGLCQDLDMIKCQQTCCIQNNTQQINQDLEDGNDSQIQISDSKKTDQQNESILEDGNQTDEQTNSDEPSQQKNPKTNQSNIQEVIKQIRQKNKEQINPAQIKKQQKESLQKSLCLQTNNKNNTICGQSCCLSGYCDTKIQQENQQKLHLRLVNKICVQNQNVTIENLCVNAGLLWCDGDCCGFLARNHKCFKMNHYGSTFIRCPIENKNY